MKPILSLPSPVELGFSDKFQAWRDDQLVAIDKTINSKKRFIGACAPTGFGKTLYGVAVSLLHPEVKRALYLTGTKGLQDQSAGDFSSVGLFDLRGARNYPCLAVESGGSLLRFRRHKGYMGCDEGPCHAGVRCDLAPRRDEPNIRPGCLYYGAVADARRSQLVSTNYAMHFASNEYSQGLGQFDLAVLDEAHETDKHLESFLTFEISAEDVGYLRSRMLGSTEVSHWRDWADHHIGSLQRRIEERELIAPSDAEGVLELRRLKATLAKLERLIELDPTEWIVEPGDRKTKFSPIRVAKYAERHLFQGIKKIILTSATLTRKTLQLLGIQPNDCEIMEFKSSFPIERRPVIAVDAVQVNAKMSADAKDEWMRCIDRIIRDRTDRCGIIHAVSYARAEEIYLRSEYRELMIFHDAGNTMAAVEQYKRRADEGTPAILVSPSIMTGFDFPHWQCRYQIIAKVPIPDMRGPIMELRKQTDPEIVNYMAMQNLVQAVGRGMRAPDDWCETFIVDDTFGNWFWKKAQKHAPRYFHEAVEFQEYIPEPLLFAA